MQGSTQYAFTTAKQVPNMSVWLQFAGEVSHVVSSHDSTMERMLFVLGTQIWAANKSNTACTILLVVGAQYRQPAAICAGPPLHSSKHCKSVVVSRRNATQESGTETWQPSAQTHNRRALTCLTDKYGICVCCHLINIYCYSTAASTAALSAGIQPTLLKEL
eukprot:GHRR01020562.1.p2 GENE.GHRR01020562.1~~GHRR01020562.1.p2  ORF type:complete len:162 (-),score=26.20 GHRR01020562.1:826-1311(-)